MEEHSNRPYKVYEADEDAVYDEEYTIDLSTLKSTVAFPHLPENTKTIDEVGDIPIDQVVIGSCTNGRFEDLRDSRRDPERQKGKEGPSRHRDSGDPAGLPGCHGGRLYPYLYRGGRSGFHTYLRTLSGRTTWVSWQRASGACPPRTGTLWDAWDMWIPRSIWPARRWRQPVPSRVRFPDRKK